MCNCACYGKGREGREERKREGRGGGERRGEREGEGGKKVYALSLCVLRLHSCVWERERGGGIRGVAFLRLCVFFACVLRLRSCVCYCAANNHAMIKARDYELHPVWVCVFSLSSSLFHFLPLSSPLLHFSFSLFLCFIFPF